MSIASARPPDTARLSHLQQLARGADRRLLTGSAALAVTGLVLALRGPHGVAAALAAGAVLPALWLAGPLAGRGIADPSSLQAATTLCAQLARQRTLGA